jgi:hypothetical protein
MQELRKSLDVLKNEEVELSWHELMWKHYKAVNQAALALHFLQHILALKMTLPKTGRPSKKWT